MSEKNPVLADMYYIPLLVWQLWQSSGLSSQLHRLPKSV